MILRSRGASGEEAKGNPRGSGDDVSPIRSDTLWVSDRPISTNEVDVASVFFPRGVLNPRSHLDTTVDTLDVGSSSAGPATSGLQVRSVPPDALVEPMKLVGKPRSRPTLISQLGMSERNLRKTERLYGDLPMNTIQFPRITSVWAVIYDRIGTLYWLV